MCQVIVASIIDSDEALLCSSAGFDIDIVFAIVSGKRRESVK